MYPELWPSTEFSQPQFLKQIVIMVEDFDTHVDAEIGGLGTLFLSLSSCQGEQEANTYDDDINQLKISLQNPLLSDNYLVIFKSLLINWTPKAASLH